MALGGVIPHERWSACAEEVMVMMVWFGSHWTFWQSGLMSIAILVFWALVIWVIYEFVTAGPPRTSRRRDDAADARHILDQRLARGEIDAEEYRRLRDLIDSDGHHPTVTRWPPEKAGSSSRR
jgi:putative membrane protein